MIIKRLLIFLAAIGLSFGLHAQHNLPSDTLLNHLTGKWLLNGFMSGKQVKHNINAGWVLGHEYFQIKETSQERDAKGHPSYEAIVYITFNRSHNQYDCLWLDNTSNAGLSNGIIAHAKKESNKLALLFKFNEHFYFHTTFIYNPSKNSWKWVMTSDDNGKKEIFANAIMQKAK